MADNTDHDEHDLGEEETAEPYKLRMTVPPVDVSVIQWLNAQRNTSQSLRQLIRESIQRDGFVDVYYKPVEQLPRRGRPPLTETATTESRGGAGSTETDIDGAEEPYWVAINHETDPGAAAAEGMREIGRRVAAAIPDAHHVPVPAPAPEAPEPEREPVPAAPAAQGQIDMDSMFNQRD